MNKRKYERVLDIADIKDQLRAMALEGAPRPHSTRERLGRMLTVMICPTSRSYYDPDFAREIRLFRPDWFKRGPNRVKENQEQLLKLASDPTIHRTDIPHRLSNVLMQYRRASHRYLAFVHRIEDLRPDWFLDIRDDAEKGELLKRAYDPTSVKPPMYELRFTKPNKIFLYDAELTAKLRALRPEWFKKRSISKERLLAHARAGLPRPEHDRYRPLYITFRRYTRKEENHDPDFVAKLMEIRPDWFVNPRLTRNVKRRSS